MNNKVNRNKFILFAIVLSMVMSMIYINVFAEKKDNDNKITITKIESKDLERLYDGSLGKVFNGNFLVIKQNTRALIWTSEKISSEKLNILIPKIIASDPSLDKCSINYDFGIGKTLIIEQNKKGSNEYKVVESSCGYIFKIIKGAISHIDYGYYEFNCVPKVTPTPSVEPTPTSTIEPSVNPTEEPTIVPTEELNTDVEPTDKPIIISTDKPTIKPTVISTDKPTIKPTIEPTECITTLEPTIEPTIEPTSNPTEQPTEEVIITPSPIIIYPIITPTTTPSIEPTIEPTEEVDIVQPTDNTEEVVEDINMSTTPEIEKEKIIDEIVLLNESETDNDIVVDKYKAIDSKNNTNKMSKPVNDYNTPSTSDNNNLESYIALMLLVLSMIGALLMFVISEKK